MGPLFSLILIAIAFNLLAISWFIPCFIISYLFYRKHKNYKNILYISSIAPISILLVTLALHMVFNIVLSIVTGVDMGIGDLWQLPLSHNVDFIMIDGTTSGTLVKGNSYLINSISEIIQSHDTVYTLAGNNVISLDLKSLVVDTINTASAPALKPVSEFYSDTLDSRYGVITIIFRILFVLIGIITSILISKFIVMSNKGKATMDRVI